MHYLKYILCAPIVFLFYLAIRWGREVFGKGYGELIVPGVIVSIIPLWFLILYIKFSIDIKKKQRKEREGDSV